MTTGWVQHAIHVTGAHVYSMLLKILVPGMPTPCT